MNLNNRPPEFIPKTDVEVAPELMENIRTQLLPPPTLKENATSKDRIEYIKDSGIRNISNILNNPSPKVQRGEIESFDKSHYGVNYDRYYKHPKFKELGFTPYRNNEDIYNAKSSHWDDFIRAMKVYYPMLGAAAWSQFKSWGDAFSGFPNTDKQAAHMMESTMAIGNSSRDTLRGKGINFALNSAYTMGIITELALEELAFWGVGAATGGYGRVATLPKTGLNIQRAAKSVSQLFRALNSPNKARQAWAMGKIGDMAAHVLPMGDTTKLTYDLVKGNKYKTLDNFAKTKMAFGTFYRDLREINAVIAESKLEAGLIKQEILDSLYRSYGDMYGTQPTGKELDKLLDTADRAAQQGYMNNLAGIYISNKIVIDTALRGLTPLRSIMRDRSGLYRVAWNKGKDGKITGHVYDKTRFRKNITKGFYWRDLSKGLHPKRLLGSVMRYSAANISEGLQELYQESLQAAYVDHYTNLYFGKDFVPRAHLITSLYKGFDYLKKHDMATEVFMSGFLMGTGAKAYQKLLYSGIPNATRAVFDNKNYTKERTKREERVAELQKSVDAILEDPAMTLNSIYKNAANVNQLGLNAESDREEGNDKRFYDSISDQLFSHVTTLYKAGMGNEFISMLKDFKNLTQEELKEALQLDPSEELSEQEVYKRLDETIERAEYIRDRLALAEKMFPNPTQGSNHNSLESIFFNTAAWNDAIDQFIFHEYMLYDTSKRMESILSKLSELYNVSQVTAGHFTSVLNEAQFKQEVNLLESEIKNLRETNDDENIKKAETKESILIALKALRDSLVGHQTLYGDLRAASIKGDSEKMENQSQFFTEGREVEYTNSKGQVIKGKIVRIKDGERVVVKRDDGKTVTVKFDTIAFTTEEKQAVKKTLDDTYEESRDKIRQIFADLIRLLTKDELEKSFNSKSQHDQLDSDDFFNQLSEAGEAMIDYAELDSDREVASLSVNTLTDPFYFNTLMERFAESHKIAYETQKKRQKEILDEFLKIENLNKLMQELYDNFQVYADPEEVERLNETGAIPQVFYKIDENGNTDEVRLGSELYSKITRYIEEFEVRNDVQFIAKPSPGTTPFGFMTKDGRLSLDDSYASTMTLKQIMSMLGIEGFEGEVTLAQIITLIRNEGSYDPGTIELLTALLHQLGANFNIEFDTKLSVAFINTEKGIKINPTVSATDYNSNHVNIFKLITSALTYSLVESTENDEKFKDEISTIVSKVIENLDNISEKRLEEIADKLGYNFEGFKEAIMTRLKYMQSGVISNSALVGNFLNDTLIRTIFMETPYETKEAQTMNAFQAFINAIKNLLSSMFNIDASNNALDEALNLINRTYFNNQVDEGSDFDSFPPELKKKLQEAYDKDNNPEKPKDIGDWVKKSKIAQDIIKDHNENTPDPNLLTDDEKKALRQLDWEDSDFPTKTTPEWRDILNRGERKKKEEKRDRKKLEAIRDEFESRLLANHLDTKGGSTSITYNIILASLSDEEKLEKLNELMVQLFPNEWSEDAMFKPEDFKDKSIDEVLESIRKVIDVNDNTAINTVRVTTLAKVDQNLGLVEGISIGKAYKEAVLEVFDAIDNYAHRGTLMDLLMRFTLPQENMITREEFEQKAFAILEGSKNLKILLTEDGITSMYEAVKEVKEKIDSLGLITLTSNAILYGNILGLNVSGETDIILLDENRNVYLFDIKTSKIGKSASVRVDAGKQISYSKQLNTYRHLLQQGTTFKDGKFTLHQHQGIITLRVDLDETFIGEGEEAGKLPIVQVIAEIGQNNDISDLGYQLPVKSLEAIYPNITNYNFKSDTPKKTVNKKVANKLIYISLSVLKDNLSILDEYENVVYLDDMLIDAINNNKVLIDNVIQPNFEGRVTRENVGDVVYTIFNSGFNAQLIKIYEAITNDVNENIGTQTMITSISRNLLGMADIVIVSNNINDYIVYNSKLYGSIEAVIKKETAEPKKLHVVKSLSLQDLLDNGIKKSRLKAPKIDLEGLQSMISKMTELDLYMELESPTKNLEYGISDHNYTPLIIAEINSRTTPKQDSSDITPTTTENNTDKIDRSEESTDEEDDELGKC